MMRPSFVWVVAAAIIVSACGGEDGKAEQERADLAKLGGKADIPAWIRHIPADFHCDSTIDGHFKGWDSAQMVSFAGKVGYRYTFSFAADYSFYRGAAIAVYDAESGDRVALARERWDNTVSLKYEAEKNVKYLVAVYSVTWWAQGKYTLSAECERLALTCKSDADCDAKSFCAKEDCGTTGTGLGSCAPMPDACVQAYAPVCGCDGRTYGNGCGAAQHRMNIAHLGACLQLKVDPQQLKSGESTTASIDNDLSETAYLGGCSPLSLEKQINGRWEPQGPLAVCVWEGIAVEVATGKSYTEQVGPSEGTYRLTSSYSLGCEANKPLSQASCRVSVPIASQPFTVAADSCWGAWLDPSGTCRTPADGVYPDACCDDKRQQFCSDLNGEYVKELQNAKSCSLVATAPQCGLQAPSDLACKNCSFFVQTTAELDKIATRWKSAGCDSQLFMCPKYACPLPQYGSCEAVDGSNTQGSCQTNYH